MSAQRFLYSALLVAILIPAISHAALSCSVTTAAACISPSTIVMRMSAATNAHSELPSQSTAGYAANALCCGGVAGIGNTCGGSFATAFKLSSTTNAQVEQGTQTNYTNNACLSISSGSVTVGYQATNCAGFDTTLGSISSVTNAHAGSPASYATKVCATAAATVQTLTFSLGSNAVNLGSITTGATAKISHTMNASTNGASGLSISVRGNTLTSGSNTVLACATNCSSTPGLSQFGINLVANTTPTIGAAPTGAPAIGTAATNYNTANSFRFVSGEVIANATGPINDTTYTLSYIANAAPVTSAGSYSTSLVYVVTANF
jgi:hypothetical protein